MRLCAWVFTEERLAMIRGRQGARGIYGLSFSTFLDIAWATLWDDVSPMADRARWHQIRQELFVEGKDPYDITWKDHDGKLQRLADTRQVTSDGKPAKSAMDQAREWQEKLRAKADALVPSGDNGSEHG